MRSSLKWRTESKINWYGTVYSKDVQVEQVIVLKTWGCCAALMDSICII